MKRLLKKIVRSFLADYQLNRIYCLDLVANQAEPRPSLPGGAVIATIDSADAVTHCSDKSMRDHAWYAGEDAIGYGVWETGELVCLSWFWTAQHANLPGRFSRLTAREAVMVDLLTTPQCRGKGYAVAIAHYAAIDLAKRGYQRLWTWVWRNNWPSVSVFKKAGWTYVLFLVEFKLAGTQRYLRFKFPPVGR